MNTAKAPPLNGLKRWFNRLWSIATLRNRYRPEVHYMRGKPSKTGRTGE